MAYYPNMNYNNSYYSPNPNNYNIPNFQQQNQFQQLQAQQVQQNQQQVQQGLQGQQVLNIEAVKVANIPYDGSITYFPNTNGDTIYTKQLNMDGTIGLKCYKLDNSFKESEANNINTNDFVSRKEFENVKNTLENLLNNLGGVNNESKQHDANTNESTRK